MHSKVVFEATSVRLLPPEAGQLSVVPPVMLTVVMLAVPAAHRFTVKSVHEAVGLGGRDHGLAFQDGFADDELLNFGGAFVDAQ